MRQVPNTSIIEAIDSPTDSLNSIPKNLALKSLITAAIGNAYELYDYTLYAVLLTILSPIFFPSDNPLTSYLLGSASFAIGFLFAPLGSIFFGWIGDLYGRRKMLNSSIMLMGLPSFIIAILPGYKQIGIIAPILLILCRIMQSLSASGEVNGSKIFALEHRAEHRHGATSALLTAFGALGVLLAMSMGAIASLEWIPHWFWRVAFLLGSLISLFGYLIRRDLVETQIFLKIQLKQEFSIFSFIGVIKQYSRQAVLVIISSGFMGMLSYLMHGFMTNYLKFYGGVPVQIAMKLNILALISTIIFAMIGGKYIDLIGNKRMIYLNTIITFIFAVPLFLGLLSGKIWLVCIAEIILGGLLGVSAVTNTIVMIRMFPPEVRCRASSFCCSLGVAVFGGSVPFIFSIMIKQTDSLLIPAYSLMLFSAILSYTTIKLGKNL